MKKVTFLGLFTLAILAFFACNREYSTENPVALSSTGSLKTLSGECLPASIGGILMKGVKADASNYTDIDIDITKPGSYLVQSDTINGIYYKAAGVFTTTGIKTVRLNASGTPLTNGTIQFTFSYNNSFCTFDVTIMNSSTPAAAFTFGVGTGGVCTGAALSGTYQAGVATTTANTAKVDVNVSTPGTYSISTTATNGVTFSRSGIFTTTGAQQVSLNATGTPAAAGSFNFILAINASTCSFAVTFLPQAQPAVFTLSGAPGNCSNAIINGTYTAQASTNATNTVNIKVDVTRAGAYSITTNPVNGLTFSGSGVFASTGTSVSVLLTASGTPVAAGTNSFTPQAGASSCSFSIVTVAAPTGIFTCKIDGVFTSFNDRAYAQTNELGTLNLHLDGYIAPPNGNHVPQLQIFITNNNASAVKAGSYNVDGLLIPNGYRIEIDYHALNTDLSVTIWNTSTTIFVPNPPFTIIVTSITPTKVRGTFSGKLANIFEGSTSQKTITEGVFDMPVQ